MRVRIKRITIMLLVLFVAFGTILSGLGLQEINADTHQHKYGSWKVSNEPTCTTKGSEYRECETCNYRETREIAAKGHLFSTHTLIAVCWQPGKKTHTCLYCGLIKEEAIPKTAHTLTKVPGQAATCSAQGIMTHYKCSKCYKKFSDAAGKKEITTVAIPKAKHNYGTPVKFNSLQHKKVCKSNKAHVTFEKHTWDKGVIKGDKITYTCTGCKETKTAKAPSAPSTGTNTTQGVNLRRVFGGDRFITATSIAKTYMETAKRSKLNAIIVACGINFPDALSGSFLARTKKAPIIVWSESKNAFVQSFIKSNVKPGGKVYILGGTLAVSDKIKNGMVGYSFERLSDTSRFGTNLKILTKCSYYNDEMLVCDGTDPGKGINALIASGTGQPVLLVKKGGLTEDQKAWLRVNDSLLNRFTIIGNTDSVDGIVEKDLKAYGSVKRIKAKDADEMSVNVAKAYFNNPTEVAIATSKNFPDGLCGGPLAIESKMPILLVTDNNCSKSVEYAKGLNSLRRVTVFGGDNAIKKATAQKFVKNGKYTWTEVTKTK